jgi:hypothetical protein
MQQILVEEIGPHLEDGSPDFRNLTSHSCICNVGDMLILVTDGVSDNFDPKMLGEEVHGVDTRAKSICACERMQRELDVRQLDNATTAEVVVDKLLGPCIAVTRASREWYECGASGKLPEDYQWFPGKMDHSTCLCLRF